MKIVQINSVCGVGSTGRICVGLAEAAKRVGHECKIAYGRSAAPAEYSDISYRITTDLEVKKHALGSRLFGKTGTYSKAATKRFIDWLDGYAPDILHLHNIHGYYVNIPMLFDYIKSRAVPVVWTLHDCFAFTGHCAYFDMVGCEKWQSGCERCPQKHAYPKSFKDSSKYMYNAKRAWFGGVENMTLVTPSQWLADLVERSFLRGYDTRVINNGIDLDVFRPTESEFRKAHGCDGKFAVLGVAYEWDERKGLDVFKALAERLGDDYRIVIVGANEALAQSLPKNIISVCKTQNARELAAIYSAADVFVNPTRQENFPTVNIEALACGTPVVTFDTGGSPEIADDSCGAVVAKNDTDGLTARIERIRREKPFSQNACVARAKQFDANDKWREYIALYESIFQGARQ